MKIKWAKINFVFCLILALVFLLLIVLLFLDSIGKETPLLRFSELSSGLFDKKSPANWISEDNIQIYGDRIVIFVNNASLSRYANTKSMDPTLDGTANGIEIPVTSKEQIHVGDLLTFRQDSQFIVHRVITIGSDEQDWYCITKGDNAVQDDGKIRFDQVVAITIAIIY